MNLISNGFIGIFPMEPHYKQINITIMKELFLASFPNMEHGVYQITLLESGNIIDTRKAIK